MTTTALAITKAPLEVSVELVDGTVVVRDLSISDEEFAAELAGMTAEGKADVCRSVFELGVRVRRLASRSADAEHLAAQLDRAEGAISRASAAAVEGIATSIRKATDPDGGAISQSVRAEIERLQQAVSAAFDDDDKKSAISRIEKAVEDTVHSLTEAAVGRIEKLLDVDAADGSFARLSRAIARDVSTPVNQLASAVRDVTKTIEVRYGVEREADKGTQKGRRYEEQVAARLEVYALAAGERVEPVGDMVGAKGNKKGDLQYIIDPECSPSSIVFESKDRKMSLAQATEYLDDACDNRIADAGVIVFSSQAKAPSNSPFSKVKPGRYIAVYDKESEDDLALRVALQCARIEAVASRERSMEDIDVSYLLRRVEMAQDLIRLIGSIQRRVSSARRSTESAGIEIETLRSGLRDLLDDLEIRIRLP